MRRFLIVVEKANGSFSAYSPDLPGCVATGATPDETTRRMQDAIAQHIRGLREDPRLREPPAALVRTSGQSGGVGCG